MTAANVMNWRSAARRLRGRVLGGRSWTEFALITAAILALPILALLGAASYYTMPAAIDPWIYTGLIHNYDDIVDRIGPTYYAARIAHVFPAMFLENVFGEHAGFIILRFLKLSIGAAALFVFGLRLYSRSVGVAGAAIWCFSPWFLRSLNDDLYDSTAALFLLLSYVFAFIPNKRPIAYHVLAGLCLAIAAQTVQLTFGVFATAAPAWLLVHRKKLLSERAATAVAGAVAFVIGYFTLTRLLLLANPRWAEGDPTFAVIKALLEGGAATWTAPLSVAVSAGYYYATAPMIAGLATAALAFFPAKARRHDRTFLIAYGLLTLLPFAFYVWRQSQNHGVLFNYFTVIYLFPAGALAATVLAGELFDRLTPNRRAASAALFTAALFGSWAFMSVDRLDALDGAIEAKTYFGVVAALLLAMFAAHRIGRNLVAAIFGSASLLFLLIGPYQCREYRHLRIAKPDGASGWDLRNGAEFLMDTVVRLSPPGKGSIGFWYPDDSGPLSMIQSVYLWGYTRMMQDKGMPTIDDYVSKSLDRFGKYMLLAERPHEIDAGLSALREHVGDTSVEISIIERGRYHSPTWSYEYALVSKRQPLAPPISADARSVGWLDLSTMATSPVWSPATVRAAKSGAKITSFPTGGGFSAIIDVPDGLRRSGPGMIRVWIKVEKGAFMVWVIKRQDSSVALQQPKTAAENGGSVLIELELADLDSPASVIFANASSDGPSVATVEAIEVAQR